MYVRCINCGGDSISRLLFLVVEGDYVLNKSSTNAQVLYNFAIKLFWEEWHLCVPMWAKPPPYSDLLSLEGTYKKNAVEEKE